MRTRILLITIIAVIASLSINATNPKVVNNTTTTESATIKESILYDDKDIPLKKTIIEYDLAGNPYKKIISNWDSKKNSWAPVHKYEYFINLRDNKLVISYTKWDIYKKDWGKETKKVIQNNQDETLSMAKQ